MKIIKQAILILILGSIATVLTAQIYNFRGLEMYNPQLTNPAFNNMDKTMQVDFLTFHYFDISYQHLDVATSLPRQKSSLGFSTDFYGNYFPMSFTNYAFDYSYKYNLLGILKISGGVSLFYSNMGLEEDTLQGPQVINRTNWGSTIGFAVKFRKLYAGMSSSFPLHASVDSLYDNRSRESFSVRSNSGPSFHFYVSTKALGQRRVKFKPVIAMDKFYFRGLNPVNTFQFYLGGQATIVNVVGLGFTLGDVNSLNATIDIFDRVSIMLGLVQANSFKEPFPRYSLNFSTPEIIAQLRFSLDK